MSVLKTRIDRLNKVIKAKNDKVCITVHDETEYVPLEERKRIEALNPGAKFIWIFAEDEEQGLPDLPRQPLPVG